VEVPPDIQLSESSDDDDNEIRNQEPLIMNKSNWSTISERYRVWKQYLLNRRRVSPALDDFTLTNESEQELKQQVEPRKIETSTIKLQPSDISIETQPPLADKVEPPKTQVHPPSTDNEEADQIQYRDELKTVDFDQFEAELLRRKTMEAGLLSRMTELELQGRNQVQGMPIRFIIS